MSLGKMLKDLKKSAPEVRFIRQKKFDVMKADKNGVETIKSAAFAGLKGKGGVRFLIPIDPPTGFVHATARQIANRLIRGDSDEQGA